MCLIPCTQTGHPVREQYLKQHHRLTYLWAVTLTSHKVATKSVILSYPTSSSLLNVPVTFVRLIWSIRQF